MDFLSISVCFVRRSLQDVSRMPKKTLESFFRTADLSNLAHQLKKRFGGISSIAGSTSTVTETGGTTQVAADGKDPEVKADEKPSSGEKPSSEKSSTLNGINFSMDNPYIQALHRRRDALVRGSAGWARWSDDDHVEMTETIASRLAQRHDGVSKLHVTHDESNRRSRQV
jgi:hypothetical protein